MKCPNCRCVVPGSMKYCSYCGFRFDNGSARTVSVTEAYSGRLPLREPDFFYFQLPVILLLGLCAVFLLFIIALLVLIL